MDLSACYLHCLGTTEEGLLKELRSRVPDIVAKAREESPEARSMEKMTVWKVNIEEDTDASNIILLKYLRAEELDVDKAQERLVATLVFRADCQIDNLAESELPECFLGHDSISGVDAEGRPVMISRFGEMDIDKVFEDVEAFVRYRTKMMEEAIALLEFKKGAAEDITQVHDYSGVMGSMYKAEVKAGVTATSKVFGEHYPEFKGKTMFINFPAVFAKPFKAFAMLLPERTQKKFVILGYEDWNGLFTHIAPGLVPDNLGGLHIKESPLKGPGAMVQIKARGAEDVTMFETKEAAKIAWQARCCTAEVSFDIIFVNADGKEEVVHQRGSDNVLQSTEGIQSGEYEAKEAGKLVSRFKNEGAWFKGRICVCRAGLAGK